MSPVTAPAATVERKPGARGECEKVSGDGCSLHCGRRRLGQADRFFRHTDEPFSTLILAPGCLLPFFLWWGNRYWSAALAGAALTMVLIPEIRTDVVQRPWLAIAVIAGGLAFELWLTPRLLRLWGFQIDLPRRNDMLLLLGAAFVSTAISGGIIMPVVYWPEEISQVDFLQACGMWWLMHFASMMVFSPAFLTWRLGANYTLREVLALTGLTLMTALCTSVGFELWPALSRFPNPLIYIGVPVFILAPLWWGARGAGVVTVTTSLMAAYATSRGLSPFAGPDVVEANYSLNVFLASLAVTTYSVGSFVTERQTALQRLRIEHALLSKAEEVAGVGSWQFDVRSRTEQWSEQFFRLLGLIPQEIPPDFVAFRERFIVPEDRQRFVEAWDSFVQTGQPDRIELRIVRADGRERMLVAQANTQRNSRGQPLRYVGTMRDVTERHQALEERRRMQELLNKAEQLAHMGSWEMDASGFVSRWSDNMYRIHGVRPDEFEGTIDAYVRQFIHPDDRQLMHDALNRYWQGGDKNSLEFRIITAGGQVRNMLGQIEIAKRDDRQIVHIVGTCADITERKQAERELQDSEQRYRLLADYSSDMISRIRKDETLAYVSPACLRMLGFTPEELANRPFYDVVHPDDRQLCCDMVRGLMHGDDVFPQPYRGQRKDGSIIWMESRARLLDDNSVESQLLCVTRDITERRRLEDQVAQSQRLEAIGRLAGGIAHDFNNILTVINGYAEILETRFPVDDPAAKHVASILEAGQRAAQMTRQLLTYSRKRLVTHGQVNLNDVVGKLESFLRPLMGEEIELICELDPQLPPVEGDAGQLEQLAMNLAINARDAMPSGGSLTLRTANVVFAPWDVRPSNLLPGRYAALIVADTGHGMDETVRSRLFEPFFTTKRAGEGTGLGLATVYATVQQGGGAIVVYSEPNQGARFEIYFPAREVATTAPPVLLPQKTAVVDSGRQRILVVEDDADVRSLVEMTLTRANFSVITAASGEDAIERVAESESRFDLLLTDVVMKGLNGRELADRLRQGDPRLPVLFMSGHTEDAVLRRGVLNDEFILLNKPFTAGELMDCIQQTLAKRRS
ncbi:MAG: PAS domain-containing protein [Planctomycetaceae bacterium]